MEVKRVLLGGAMVYPELLLGFRRAREVFPMVVSYYDRSQSAVTGFGAQLTVNSFFDWNRERYALYGLQYDSFVQPIVSGKEKFYHGISIVRSLDESYLLVDKQRRGQMVYNYLMKNFDLPLLQEWGEPLLFELIRRGCMEDGTFRYVSEACDPPMIPIDGEDVPLGDIEVYRVDLTQERLNQIVSDMLQKKCIRISDKPMVPLGHKDIDTYFQNYGHTIVENLNRQITPLVPILDGEAHDFTLNSMRLYPQQLAQLNGDVALLEHGKYAILNHGMGTGKTILGAGICESYFNRKWLRSHPGKALEDAYYEDGIVNYRVVIMCPGHLVAKWAKEIREQVPFAKVEVIKEFSQLIALRERGVKRSSGKEFYVMSKDFSKLSYQSEPTPKKRRRGRLKRKMCVSCGKEFLTPGATCPHCGCREYAYRPTRINVTGMVCPKCNNVLLGYERLDGDADVHALDFSDFTAQKATNERCYYCDEELWQPHIANLGEQRKKKWIRVTHFANKAHKAKKTVWAHEDYLQEYLDEIQEPALNIIDSGKNPGSRKYAPAEFIKRYMKGFFDLAIFDEIQDLKGGATGQGHAMHCLIKASKKQLALTGTIAGGYANHLFYTLWRLDPQRMVDKGFTFYSELKFSEAYGQVEKTFAYDSGYSAGSEEYNVCCKGKQKQSPKVKPGISPLIFKDFLLDRCTFLDLSDMSKYLPKLKEMVVSVSPSSEPEQCMYGCYRRVVECLKQASREKSGGFGVLSKMLQFSLSYLDKPYGVQPILSPRTGGVLSIPESYDQFAGEELSSKEKKLVELINSEIAEGRGVVVFAEYTASIETCVSWRLQKIIEDNCGLKGRVAVLESETPKASEREAWMHKMAQKGTKVFITNPRCVATGLDFCFEEDGVEYNYPTLIFYQLGYSLFVTWQASRRAFRLNQRKECRTFYMAWAGSAQEAVISLIAEKQAATAAIQGHFSAEGLSAMAQGVDTRVKLAQALSDMDSITGNGLQEMFDVLAEENNDATFSDYKPMLLYKELMGEDAVPEGTFEQVKTGQIDLLSMLAQMNPMETAQAEEPVTIVESVSAQTVVVQSSIPVMPLVATYNVGKKMERRLAVGQLALF